MAQGEEAHARPAACHAAARLVATLPKRLTDTIPDSEHRVEIPKSELGGTYSGGAMAPTLLIIPDVTVKNQMVQSLS